MSMAPLQYLDFDASDDEHGIGSFDAMASVLPAQVPALHAELARVLAWAHDAFARGPLDEGFDWDYDLQRVESAPAHAALHFEESSRTVRDHLQAGVAPGARYTATLTLSGTSAFCAALRAAFGLE